MRPTPRPPRFALALTALAALASGCGGDSGTNPGPGSAAMTASIDGAAWAADENLASAQAVPGVPGAYIVQGSHILAGSDALSVLMLLYNIAGPGTYPLGTGLTVIGGSAQVTTAAEGWITPLSGAAGTVEITALTPTRIAGTFSYTADAAVGGATGSRTVTGGQFDLLLGNASDPLTPLPGNAGGFFHATIGGAAFNAATVAASDFGSNLIMSASTDTRSVSLVLTSVTAPGTYALSSSAPSRTAAVLEGAVQWGAGAGMTGSVNVTSLSSQRAIGTFDVTLDPVSGTTSQLSLTGAFDIGLP